MARRRLTAGLALIVVLAGGGVAAFAATRHDGKGDPTTTTSSPSTTTVKKAVRPTSYHVGLAHFRFVDPTRSTVSPVGGAPIPGRILETDVLYPSIKGSASGVTDSALPASSDGPFPVVVFAHGFDVSPSYYFPLLEAWARAGLVVVAPVFPDENTDTVNAHGGPTDTSTTQFIQGDVANEPGDIVFVLKKFDALAGPRANGRLAGLADTSDLALAGQSDGANVVAALAFGTAYKTLRHELAHKEKAVLVLSGETLYSGPGGAVANTVSSSSASPPFLQVQSDADTCNLVSSAADLFNRLGHDPVHLFEMLHGASHLEPYTSLDLPNAYAPVVEKVTTQFLELELAWNDRHLSLASLERAGTVPSISELSSTLTASQYAASPTAELCTGLPVITPGT